MLQIIYSGRLIVVCKHVISRISLYWLPRYVLSKMDNHHSGQGVHQKFRGFSKSVFRLDMMSSHRHPISDDLDFTSFSRSPVKDPGQVIVNLLPPESDYNFTTDNPEEKLDVPLDKPIIPPVVRLSTPYHSDIGDSGIESGSESDFSQRNIIFSHRNLSKL